MRNNGYSVAFAKTVYFRFNFVCTGPATARRLDKCLFSICKFMTVYDSWTLRAEPCNFFSNDARKLRSARTPRPKRFKEK